MERNTQIWIGVVVLAALGGAVYFKAKEDQKIGTSQTTSADLPDLATPADVDKLEITNADKETVVLEKRNNVWELTKPLAAPANQGTAKAILDNLKDLKSKEVISASPSEDQKKEFNFEPKKDVHLIVYKGSDKKLDIHFGKSGARGQLAMVEGKPAIYTVAGYSSYLYQRETKGWREAEMLKFDDANANQLTIEKGKDVLSFTKEGEKWAGSFKGKPLERFDEEKPKEAVKALHQVNAEDFADGKSPSDTGLDAPEATMSVQLKDGAGKYVLKIGKVANGTSRYVQKDGDPQVYILPKYTTDWALEGESKFQKAADAGAPDAGAAKKPEPLKKPDAHP